MKLDNMILTDFAAAIISPPNSNGEQTTRATVISVDENDDKLVTIRLDGSDEDTAATTMVKCEEDDRVMVLLKGHKATVIGNISSPVLKKVTANDIEAGAVTASAITTQNIESDNENSWINFHLGTFNFGEKLIWDGSDLTVKGTITAGSGSKIGPWTISDDQIYKDVIVSGTEYRPILHAPNTITGSTKAFTVAVKPNGQSWTYPFAVTYDGTLTATKGTIGPWHIDSNNSIWSGNSAYGNANGMYFGTSGISLSDKFKVSAAGAITSTSGTIGGFTIDGNSLKNGNYIDLCAYESSAGYTGARIQLGPGNGAHASLNSEELVIYNANGVDSYIKPTAIYTGGTITSFGAITAGSTIAANYNGAMIKATNPTYGNLYAGLHTASNGFHGIYSNGYWNGSALTGSGRWLIYRNTADNTCVESQLYTHNEGYTTLRPVVGTNAGTNAVGVIVSNSATFGIYGRWGGGATAAMSGRTISCPASDIRLKENVEDSTIDALSVINAIKIRQFDWKDKSRGHWDCGMVVDEMEKDIDPKFCIGGGEDEDGNISYKSVDTFYLQGYEVKAIQELSARIEELERRLNEQRS